jgi:hypothetical protein
MAKSQRVPIRWPALPARPEPLGALAEHPLASSA